MPTTIYKEDQAESFGKWNDKTSKFIYQDSCKEILQKVDIRRVVADYGGANGNLKSFIPNAISIDKDISKNPDIVDDILTHKGNYDLIVIRFVLHYLNDYEVLQLFEHIKSYHKGEILVIQFCNNDLKSKYNNSVNEFKYFRTEDQLQKLLPPHKFIYSKSYICSEEFYLNRLKLKNAKSHKEVLNAYLIKSE